MLRPRDYNKQTLKPTPLPRGENSSDKDYCLKILRLRKQFNKNSVYECDSASLRKWLEPIKDLEVAIIPIVGPSRMGKSFILNYLCRYLSDPKNNDWMGRRNVPLEGFLWKAETEPQTDGMMISRPYIIERADAKQIAVILCDTQGVFDQYTSKRDWATIVGISLLISSTLIFNIFTGLQEDAFIFLESFLEYGLAAANSLPNKKSAKPFQKLLFLIRDWAVPQKYKYGLSGGRDYLENKLVIEKGQEESAKDARTLLSECFAELECFLMPKMGEKSDDIKFNGSVGQLGADFKRKLSDFVITLLNPDEIQTKLMNDKNITGEEFCDLFESYVKVFNSTSQMEKPSVDELASATSRIADNIHMRRVKASHLIEFQTLVESKPFLSRKELTYKCKQTNDEYIRVFEDEMSSDNSDFVDKMEDSFEQNFEIIYSINENKRKEFMEIKVEECRQQFLQLSSNQISESMDLIAFDTFLKNNEKKVLEQFKQSYLGEEENLFLKDLLNLTEYINRSKDQLKRDYSQSLSEAEKTKIQFLERSVDNYQIDMQYVLDNNVLLTKDQFKQLENQIRSKTVQSFEDNFKVEESNVNRFYALDLDQRIKKVKNVLKAFNTKKTEEVFSKTEELLRKSIDDYNRNMNQMIDFIETNEELIKRHDYIKNTVREEFTKNCLYKETAFLDQFLTTFENEIEKSFENFRNRIGCKINLFQNAFIMAFNSYKNNIESISSNQLQINQKDLDKSHRSFKNIARELYEKQFTNGKPSENLYLRFQMELNNKIEKEFDQFVEELEIKRDTIQDSIESLSNEMLGKFNRKIGKIIKDITSESDLALKLSELKRKIISEFSDKLNVSDQSLIEHGRNNLENLMDESFNEKRGDLDSKKEGIKRVFISDVKQSLEAYTQKMDSFVNSDNFYGEQSLENTHKSIKQSLIHDFVIHHDLVLGIDPKDYETKLSNEIDDHFEQYLNRKNESNKQIQENLDFQHNSYTNQMSTKLVSINSEEELAEEHSRIQEMVEEAFYQRNHSIPKQVLSKYIQTLRLKTNESFDAIKIKFNERQHNLIQSFEKKIEEARQNYYEKMAEYFEEGEFYETENIRSIDKTTRKNVLDDFKKFLSSQRNLKLDTLAYQKSLEKQITEEFNTILERNSKNRMSSVEGLRNECQKICEKYNSEMKSIIDSIGSESALIYKHELIVEKLKKELDSINFNDKSMLEIYREDILRELADSRIQFEGQVKEKILENYESELLKLKNNYVQKMEDLFKSDQLFSKEILNEKHQEYMTEEIHYFEDIFTKEFDFSLEQFTQEISNKLVDEFKKFVQKYHVLFSQRKLELNQLIVEFTDKYENAIDPFIKSIESKAEMEVKHNEIKSESLRVFKELSVANMDLKELEPFINELQNKIENKFKSSILNQWQIQVNHRQPLIENLKLKASKYYQDEIKKKMEKKLYFEDKELKEIHSKISESTIKKFEKEFGSLNKNTYLQSLRECLKVVFDNVFEKNDMFRPNKSHAIGIDLGTTNSCVSYFKPTAQNKFNCVIIPNELGHPTTASVVSIRDDEEVIGDVAKEETYGYPRNTIISAKRLIGRKFNDESVQKSLKLWSYEVFDDGNNNPKIKVNVNGEDKEYFPEQISAKVLRKMKDIAVSNLGCDVTKAVITVPAYFNDAQKEATKDAAKIAGLEVMRIINEPTAAAIAYRLNWTIDSKPRNVLIYDFGGGTFDVAVLVISQGEIEVKAVGGDNHLGGDDFDTNIINYCLEDFTKKYGKKVEGDEGEKAICRLRLEAEKCKIKLSSLEKTKIFLRQFYETHDLDVTFSRGNFEYINNRLIDRSMDLVLKTLSEAALNTSDIADIVLVGGSTRIPKVQERLSELFDGRPLNHSVNPDEAVAVGAAINAALLNEKQSVPLGDLKLSDVTPLSLGIEILHGKFSVIIPKNTKVPTSMTEDYTTVSDNQTSIEVKIYEGENTVAKHNNLLGIFKVTDIPPGKAGEQIILVTCELTNEGILKVTAKVQSTGKEKDIKIVAHKGRLTPEKLEQLIKEGA